MNLPESVTDPTNCLTPEEQTRLLDLRQEAVEGDLDADQQTELAALEAKLAECSAAAPELDKPATVTRIRLGSTNVDGDIDWVRLAQPDPDDDPEGFDEAAEDLADFIARWTNRPDELDPGEHLQAVRLKTHNLAQANDVDDRAELVVARHVLEASGRGSWYVEDCLMRTVPRHQRGKVDEHVAALLPIIGLDADVKHDNDPTETEHLDVIAAASDRLGAEPATMVRTPSGGLQAVWHLPHGLQDEDVLHCRRHAAALLGALYEEIVGRTYGDAPLTADAHRLWRLPVDDTRGSETRHVLVRGSDLGAVPPKQISADWVTETLATPAPEKYLASERTSVPDNTRNLFGWVAIQALTDADLNGTRWTFSNNRGQLTYDGGSSDRSAVVMSVDGRLTFKAFSQTVADMQQTLIGHDRRTSLANGLHVIWSDAPGRHEDFDPGDMHHTLVAMRDWFLEHHRTHCQRLDYRTGPLVNAQLPAGTKDAWGHIPHIYRRAMLHRAAVETQEPALVAKEKSERSAPELEFSGKVAGVEGHAADDWDEADEVVSRRTWLNGAHAMLDLEVATTPIWGQGDEVAWADGESLLIAGGIGAGKTTIASQLVAARLGIIDTVLDMPVEPAEGRVGYLAMDRPKQAIKSLRRILGDEAHRELLEERLRVWYGPLAADVATHPKMLIDMCRAEGIDTLFVDSAKDAAVGLTDDAVGAGFNQAMQILLAEGTQVVILHHNRKATSDGKQPKHLDDIYGSTWIPAGAGSAIILWQDPSRERGERVEFIHVKEPATNLGRFGVKHDHKAGISHRLYDWDPVAYLQHQPGGATVDMATTARTRKQVASDSERQVTRRQLNKLVEADQAHTVKGIMDGTPGRNTLRYFWGPKDDEDWG